MFFCKFTKKRKEVPCMELSRFNDQKWKESPYMEKSRDKITEESAYMQTSRDSDKKEAYLSNVLQLQKPSSLFILEKQIASFSYQCTICTTKSHGFQLHWFHGQANLFRLCRLWRTSRFGRFSESENDSHYLDVKTQIFHEK